MFIISAKLEPLDEFELFPLHKFLNGFVSDTVMSDSDLMDIQSSDTEELDENAMFKNVKKCVVPSIIKL